MHRALLRLDATLVAAPRAASDTARLATRLAHERDAARAEACTAAQEDGRRSRTSPVARHRAHSAPPAPRAVRRRGPASHRSSSCRAHDVELRVKRGDHAFALGQQRRRARRAAGPLSTFRAGTPPVCARGVRPSTAHIALTVWSILDEATSSDACPFKLRGLPVSSAIPIYPGRGRKGALSLEPGRAAIPGSASPRGRFTGPWLPRGSWRERREASTTEPRRRERYRERHGCDVTRLSVTDPGQVGFTNDTLQSARP